MYRIESCFDYKGYKLVVVFNDLGHRCGYIGIPEGKPLYGKRFLDEDFPHVHIHGGITFSDFTDYFPRGKRNNLWWIGFDTAHINDARDIASAYRYGMTHVVKVLIDCERDYPWRREVRTLKYCKKELIRVVDEMGSGVYG